MRLPLKMRTRASWNRVFQSEIRDKVPCSNAKRCQRKVDLFSFASGLKSREPLQGQHFSACKYDVFVLLDSAHVTYSVSVAG